MCTCMIAGRKATAAGYAVLAANDDWDGVPGVLTHTAQSLHKEDETYILTGGLEIPQVPETCGYVYTACRYSIGNLDRGWAGGMNDRGVAAAGTGVDAYKPVEWKSGGYGLEPDDIPLLILQRGTGARQAVRMIGDLIQKYGLRPSYLEGSAGLSAATFSITDREEGWVLEVYPGRCWVAVRVPDDMVSVRVNAFGTHDADLTDPENTMASPGLAEYARSRGFWNGDERHFDFAGAFGADTSPTEWGPELDPMNLRRRWRAMYLVSGEKEPEEALRYQARPAKLLHREDMMCILSDVYEGTPYDLTKVPEAGQWHDPFADDLPDYAICRRGTVSSFVTAYAGNDPVSEAGTESPDPLLWTALGTPRMVPYVPVWAGIGELPDCCTESEPEQEDSPSLFWEFKKLCMLTQRRYDRNIRITAQMKQACEQALAIEVEIEQEKIAAAGSPAEASLMRTEYTAAHIGMVREECRQTKSRLLKDY